jgi:hypothetical protein
MALELNQLPSQPSSAQPGSMAGKDIAVKKYVVRLNAQGREQLQALM